MSMDDPTTKLPDEEKYDTKPGITAVLERINALGEQLNKRIDDLRADIHRLDRKIELYHEDLTNYRIKQRDLEDRVDKLEQKPS